MMLLIYRIFRKINLIRHQFITALNSSFYKIYFRSAGIIGGEKIKVCGKLSLFITTGSNIHIGKNCQFNSINYYNHLGINHNCIISTECKDAKIHIGKNCGFSGTSINCFKSIIIGDNVRCGANTNIMDSDFHLDDVRSNPPSPIHIGNNVWLGTNVTVMKGVTIGENTIIGANSIVTHDIPPSVIAAGNPCKVIKNIKQ